MRKVGAGGSMGDSSNPEQPLHEDDNGEHTEGEKKHHHHPHLRRETPKTADSHDALDWYRSHYGFERGRGAPSTLSMTSAPDGTGMDGDPNHVHRHGFFFLL
jgi:hypothetical protein